MRILGFSKKWDKLNQVELTTFRYPRRDKDWFIGEIVQIVYHPRSKDREILGIAEITNIEKRAMAWHGDKSGETKITNEEAKEDGFDDNGHGAYFTMWEFLWDYYGGQRLLEEPMNKITLRKQISFNVSE